MSHINDDQLLLYVYGDLGGDARAGTEDHLLGCGECRARLVQLEEASAAVDMGLAHRARRVPRVAWLALPLAAGLGALLLLREPEPGVQEWRPHFVGSATAGYVTGGADFLVIDSLLTRLEQRNLP